MLSDLRQALRLLIRQPGFTAAACATLALGIGANTAIFSVVDAALFRPLPYRDADRLVDVLVVERRGTPEETRVTGTSWERVGDWRAQTQLFEGVATYASARSARIGLADGAPASLVGRVSPGFLEFLGLTPRLGREFSEADWKGDGRVALLSYGFWRRAFNGDPGVLGTAVVIDGRSHLVVGVAPESFRFLAGFNTDLWIPQMERRPADITVFVARLRSGLSWTEAERQLDLAARRIQDQHPGSSPWEVDLRRIDARRDTDAAATLLVLLGAVGFVLLIACANVANLLLSRALTRQREVAVRTALGATRARLIRQFLVEGLTLSVCGGACGVVLALWMIDVIPSLVPVRLQYALFGANALAIDARLMAAAAGCLLVTGLICSTAPAIRGSRLVAATGFAGTQIVGTTASGRRLRQTLLSLQVALTLVLVVGAALLVNSFVRMVLTEPGFDINRFGSVSVSLPASALPDATQQEAAYGALLERVRALPGVEAAAFGAPPPTGSAGRFMIERPGAEPELLAAPLSIHFVAESYFDVTGLPVVAGRPIESQDRSGAFPVAVIDEVTARRGWPGVSPIGSRFRYSPYVPWMTVVGVAGRVKTQNFSAKSADAQIYLPIAANSGTWRYRPILIRSSQPSAVVASAAGIVRTVHPAFVVEMAGVVSTAYDGTLSSPRFYLRLMAVLAVVALLTAAVGLYGLLACAVGERTREIGVRIALGADRTRVGRLMIRDALVPVAGGIAAGVAAALWLTRFLESLLYQVTRLDPVTFAAAILCLLVTATIAAAVPIRRAMRVDPIAALKSE